MADIACDSGLSALDPVDTRSQAYSIPFVFVKEIASMVPSRNISQTV